MQFQILSVEFDVDDSCYDPSLEPPTSEELAENYIGEIWEADDEDDLIEEITNDAAYCILSILMEEVKEYYPHILEESNTNSAAS